MGELINNIKYNIISKIFSMPFSLLLDIIIIKTFGVKKYGFYSLILSISSFLKSICMFGIVRSTPFFMAKYKKNINKLKESYFTLSTLIFLVVLINILFLILFLPYLASIYSIPKNLLHLIIFLFFFEIFIQYFSNVFIGMSKFKFLSILNLFTKLLRFVLIFLVVVLTSSVRFVLTFEIILKFLFCLIAFFYLKKFIIITLNISLIKEILNYSKKLFAVEIILNLKKNFFRLALGLFSLESVGIYSASLTMTNIILVFSTIISQPFFPRIVSVIHNKHEVKKYVYFLNKFSSIFLIGISSIIFAFREQISYIFLRGENILVIKVLTVIILAQIINVLFGNLYLVANALNKQEYNFLTIFFQLFFTGFFSIILIPKYSAFGAAIVLFLTNLLGVLILFFLLNGYINIRMPIKTIIVCFFSSFVVILIISLLIQYTESIFSIILSILVFPLYFIIIYKFKIITKEEIIYLKKFLKIKESN